MIEMRAMTPDDYEHMSQYGDCWWKGDISALAVGEIYSSHPAFSVLWKGEVVMVGGIVRTWPMAGEAWAIVRPKMSALCAICVNRMAKRTLIDIAKNMGLKRLQANVDEGFSQANKWARFLGFKKRTTFTRYVMMMEDGNV